MAPDALQATVAITATWRPLTLAAPHGTSSQPGSPSQLQRSSHSLAVVGDRAFIFGGELKPRTPVGAQLLELPLGGGDGGAVKVHEPPSDPAVPWPPPRVGAAMCSVPASAATPGVGDSLYLFGGRGGEEMKPIPVAARAHSSPADAAAESVWRYDVATSSWSQLVTSAASPSEDDKGSVPAGRSYHAVAYLASNHSIYVHAGCPEKGRLSTLHRLDLATNVWHRAADAPGPARGGTALVSLVDEEDDGDGGDASPSLLARWGGFAGYELGGPLDVYDAKRDVWRSYRAPLVVPPSDVAHGDASSPVAAEEREEPPKRSVHALLPLPASFRRLASGGGGSVDATPLPVALMLLGEGEGAPAELGHAGAGKFLGDAYALLRLPRRGKGGRTAPDGGGGGGDEATTTTEAGGVGYAWLTLEHHMRSDGVPPPTDGAAAAPTRRQPQGPEPRGWFGADVAVVGSGETGAVAKVVVHGGLNEANERLADAWTLEVRCGEA